MLGDRVPAGSLPSGPPPPVVPAGPAPAPSGAPPYQAPPPPPPPPTAPTPPTPAQPFSYPPASETPDQAPPPEEPAAAGAPAPAPGWPPPMPAPAPAGVGAMPPPSPWERTAVPPPPGGELPPWGTLVLEGAARSWMIFAIVWGSVVFVGQSIAQSALNGNRQPQLRRGAVRRGPPRRPVPDPRLRRRNSREPDPPAARWSLTERTARRGRDAVTFEELVAEGSAVPVEGWDFSWFEGRATEERPPWGYAHLMGERMAGAASALDVQTGGGEVLATVARPPALLVATESWPPNVARGPRPPARAGCPRGRGGRRAGAALCRRLLRPRDEPPPRRRAVGGDRPGPAAGRDVPVPTDRRGLQPGADRFHHGPTAA